jgi:hypothetical protein
MATERIISPGVFTNENDLSFLPAGIAQIGAAFVGPTLKGPALVPMQVTSFQDYQVMFGGEDSTQTYIPYAIKNYLKNASSAMVVRILGNGGWTFTTDTNKLAAVAVASTGSTITYQIVSGLHPAKNNTSANFDLRASTAISGNISNNFTLVASGSNLTAKTYTVSINRQNTTFISKVIGSTPDSTKISNTSYNNGIYSYVTFEDFSTNIANGYGVSVSSGSSTFTLLGTANNNYTTAFSVTSSIGSGNSFLTASSGWSSTPTATQNWLLDSEIFVATLTTASIKAAMPIESFNFITGSPQYLNIGLETTSNPIILNSTYYEYIPTLTTYNPSSGTFTMYLHSDIVWFAYPNTTFNINTTSYPFLGTITPTKVVYPVVSGSSTPASFIPTVTVLTSSYNVTFPDYNHASTPWITSGLNGFSVKTTQNLFKVHHLSDGNDTNTDVKISITNLREFSSGSYSTFDLLVRSYSDTDNRPSILEQYRGVNLDPDSPQYIARVIGDKYKEFVTSTNKVVEYGNYNNVSKYVRIEMDPAVDSKAVSETLSPRGFRKLKQTFIGFTNANMPPASYTVSQNDSDQSYVSNRFLGWDFGAVDNVNYLKAIPTSASIEVSAINSDFIVDNLVMPINSGFTYTGDLKARVDITGVTGPTANNVQFTVPMQGGSDGMSPARIKLAGGDITATNSFGYDLSTATSNGSIKYTDAFDMLSNQDEYDINMLLAPGVIRRLHPYVANYMISTAEGRQDTFVIVDNTAKGDSIATAANQTANMDSNYAATYYPWMQVLDASVNKPIWVPPSVLMPGVLAYNDSVAAEWYAPAGLNRGGITDAINIETKLNHSERDTLYENQVNPIASFPSQGICAWGQKTLQQKPSALDRINVRRLLITVKKYIASTSRYLVFEQNTAATRNRFLSIVNPYLESIQQRQGLYAFKVVMDDTNNTPAVIDRNLLVGDIYLQPAKTAEFIVINFNLTPTGAEFPA